MKYSNIKKYKYRVEEEEVFHSAIIGYNYSSKYFSIELDGKITAKIGYLWDGVSGPTWDSNNTMTGGLGHDLKYQMIRMEIIKLIEKYKADLEFKDDLLKDGMCQFRAWYYYETVDKFGKSSCIPGDIKIPKIRDTNK